MTVKKYRNKTYRIIAGLSAFLLAAGLTWSSPAPENVKAAELSASVDSSSGYVPTNIINGDFQQRPWMPYIFNGRRYDSPGSGFDASWNQNANENIPESNIFANGVDRGWNTSETKTQFGDLFEWLNGMGQGTGNWTGYNSNIINDSTRSNYFVELNAANCAVLYQDLTTHGGDVIRWSFKHGVRVSGGDSPATQNMKVFIGAPNMKDGVPVKAHGINSSINHEIRSNDALATYTSEGKTGKYAFANSNELKALMLTKASNSDKWYVPVGVYIVPEGQNITRFAFMSIGQYNAGNLMDDVTFSTLIGNLDAKISKNGAIAITGYWGETNSSKKLIVRIGSNPVEVNMTSVQNKNFIINIPADIIGSATSISIYHQDYESASITIVPEHSHAWKTTASDNKIIKYCTNTAQSNFCDHQGEAHAFVLSITGRNTVKGKDTGANVLFSEEAFAKYNKQFGTDLGAGSIKYYQQNGYTPTSAGENGAVKTGGAPTEPGMYVAKLTVDGKTASVGFKIKADESEDDDLDVNLEDNDANEGDPEGPSKIIRDLGYINYSAREHVCANVYNADDYAMNPRTASPIPGMYLDLNDERLVTSVNVAGYSVNGGRKWVSGNLDAFNKKLPKILDKASEIRFTDSFNSSRKAPAEGAAIYAVASIAARQKMTPKLKVNYSACRDDYGLTNGQWVLFKGTAEAPMADYEIGISDNSGKKLGENGYGLWPGIIDGLTDPADYGGVWVSDLPSNGKTGKETYFYRLRPVITEDGTIKPASKTAKIKVLTMNPAPKLKVDYKKEIIKLKSGVSIYFGNSPVSDPSGSISFCKLPDNPKSYDDFSGKMLLKAASGSTAVKRGIDILGYISGPADAPDAKNTICIWQAATSRKPASVALIIELAKRAPAPTDAAEIVRISNGKAKLLSGYELYSESDGKWVSSISSKIASGASFTVRKKATAKGGQEKDSTFAAGVSVTLVLEYGVINEETGKEGFTGASLKE